MIGFSGFIGYASNMQAELETIRHDLITTFDIGAPRMLLETDSLEAIHLIHHADVNTYMSGVSICNIKKLHYETN